MTSPSHHPPHAGRRPRRRPRHRRSIPRSPAMASRQLYRLPDRRASAASCAPPSSPSARDPNQSIRLRPSPPHPPASVDGDQNRCELDSMAVHPDARRQGLGAALLHAILAWAAHHGRPPSHPRSPSRQHPRDPPFTSVFGIRTEEGRRPGYYRHPEEDAVLLGMADYSRSSSPLVFHREIV